MIMILRPLSTGEHEYGLEFPVSEDALQSLKSRKEYIQLIQHECLEDNCRMETLHNTEYRIPGLNHD